jgi:hypothetical protein
MSQENLELVRDLFEQWSVGNYEFLIETADPDVEIFSRLSSLGVEPYRGPEGIRSWIAEIELTSNQVEVRASEFRDLGNRVLALGVIGLQGRRVALKSSSRWAGCSNCGTESSCACLSIRATPKPLKLPACRSRTFHADS